jgi:hypothetical protein
MSPCNRLHGIVLASFQQKSMGNLVTYPDPHLRSGDGNTAVTRTT